MPLVEISGCDTDAFACLEAAELNYDYNDDMANSVGGGSYFWRHQIQTNMTAGQHSGRASASVAEDSTIVSTTSSTPTTISTSKGNDVVRKRNSLNNSDSSYYADDMSESSVKKADNIPPLPAITDNESNASNTPAIDAEDREYIKDMEERIARLSFDLAQAASKADVYELKLRKSVEEMDALKMENENLRIKLKQAEDKNRELIELTTNQKMKLVDQGRISYTLQASSDTTLNSASDDLQEDIRAQSHTNQPNMVYTTNTEAFVGKGRRGLMETLQSVRLSTAMDPSRRSSMESIGCLVEEAEENGGKDDMIEQGNASWPALLNFRRGSDLMNQRRNTVDTPANQGTWGMMGLRGFLTANNNDKDESLSPMPQINDNDTTDSRKEKETIRNRDKSKKYRRRSDDELQTVYRPDDVEDENNGRKPW